MLSGGWACRAFRVGLVYANRYGAVRHAVHMGWQERAQHGNDEHMLIARYGVSMVDAQ